MMMTRGEEGRAIVSCNGGGERTMTATSMSALVEGGGGQTSDAYAGPRWWHLKRTVTTASMSVRVEDGRGRRACARARSA